MLGLELPSRATILRWVRRIARAVLPAPRRRK